MFIIQAVTTKLILYSHSDPAGTSMSKLLGICIPTFNRAGYLRENLDSIVPQFAVHGLPIFISDNCSDDGTDIVVKQFQAIYPNIQYRKNSENIGAYRNILAAIKMATTEYIWMMGDDDKVIEGAVDRILERLKTNIDFVVLNSIGYNSTMQIRNGNGIKCSEDRTIQKGSHEALITYLSGAYHGFMSSMIIKRSIISNLVEEFDDVSFAQFGNSWLPLMLFYKAIVNKIGIVICDPALQSRLNHRPDKKNFFQYFYIDHLSALLYLRKCGYGLKCLKKAAYFGPLSITVQMLRGGGDKGKLSIYRNFIKHCAIIPLTDKFTFLVVERLPTNVMRALTNVVSEISQDTKMHF